jgi:hypothetical protein
MYTGLFISINILLQAQWTLCVYVLLNSFSWGESEISLSNHFLDAFEPRAMLTIIWPVHVHIATFTSINFLFFFKGLIQDLFQQILELQNLISFFLSKG